MSGYQELMRVCDRMGLASQKAKGKMTVQKSKGGGGKELIIDY